MIEMAKNIDDYKEEIKELKKKLKAADKAGITVDKENCRLVFNNHVIDLHPVTLDALTKKPTKVGEYPEIIANALNVGLLARKQGRLNKSIESFNDKLESDFSMLSQHMDILQHKLEKDNKYKTDLEIDVVVALKEFRDKKGYSDIISDTGTKSSESGLSSRNKTGDALVTIDIDKNKRANIGIEVKMASKYTLGDISSKSLIIDKIRTEDDSALSQILETNANNNAVITIFVTDREDLDPFPELSNIQFFPSYRGFMVKVDVMSGDYSNLQITYEIAREMAISKRSIEGIDTALLMFMIENIEQLTRRHKLLTGKGSALIKEVKESHNTIIQSLEGTLIGIDSEVKALADAMRWTNKCMKGLIETGELSVTDAFSLYTLSDANLVMESTRKELGEYYEENSHPLPGDEETDVS